MPKFPPSVHLPNCSVTAAPAKYTGHIHNSIGCSPITGGDELAKDRHIIGVEYTITDTEAKTTADNHREVVPKS